MRNTYTAAVEVATKRPLDVDELIAALSQYEPSVGTSPRGWLEVRLNLPATTLGAACTTAISVASAATGAEAIACEVMTERESDERKAFVPYQRDASQQHQST